MGAAMAVLAHQDLRLRLPVAIRLPWWPALERFPEQATAAYRPNNLDKSALISRIDSLAGCNPTKAPSCIVPPDINIWELQMTNQVIYITYCC